MAHFLAQISELLNQASESDSRFLSQFISSNRLNTKFELLDVTVNFYKIARGFGFSIYHKGECVATGLEENIHDMFAEFISEMPSFPTDDERLLKALDYHFATIDNPGYKLDWCKSNLSEEDANLTHCYVLTSGAEFYVEKDRAIWLGKVVYKGITCHTPKFMDVHDLIEWVELNDRPALQQVLAGSCTPRPQLRSLAIAV
jgi:hypothetical protein